MEEMEVRTEDLEVVETNDKEANGSSGIGVGLAMLIGSGLTLAAIAGGKKLINLWADHKAKRIRWKWMSRLSKTLKMMKLISQMMKPNERKINDGWEGANNKALSLFYFIRRCLNGRLYSEFSQV